MIHIHYDAQATEGAGGVMPEGNKLIAEFMGGKVTDKLTSKPYPSGLPSRAMRIYDFDTLRIGGYDYNSSWDWLMPVVEKIADTPMENFIDEKEEDGGYAFPVTFGMRTEIGEWMVRFRGHVLHTSNTLIGAAWEAVVDFIKWHNEQK